MKVSESGSISILATGLTTCIRIEPETVSSEFATAPPEAGEPAATDLAMDDCVDEPLTVAVAVKVAQPVSTAVITPDESMVAIVGSLDDHVTVAPVISSPFSSSTSAERSTVSPTGA